MGKNAALAAVAASLLFIVCPAVAQRTLNVASVPPSEQRVALVIGNSAYTDAPLNNPINDAVDVASALRELGFEVLLRQNSSQRDMKQAIREFGHKLSRGGVGLFYFAGHGVQWRGRNYLVPIGAQIHREADVEDETVDANFVLAQMEEARNRVSIVILDACRNNPYSRGFRSATRGLAQMDATSGTLIAFATAPGAVAADGDGRNGVYTKHLLRQMREGGVPVELMLKRVRDAVMAETKDRQVPWESSSLRGADFYFRPSATASSTAISHAEDLRIVKQHMARGNALLMQGKAHDANLAYEPAFDLLKQMSTDALDDDAKVALGRLYIRLARDSSKADSILRPLAHKGHPEAQNTIGNFYRDGTGVPKDAREAAAWYRKSAEQGNAFAQNSLGVLLRDGRGVAKDEREAARWFRKAAEQGNAAAQNSLGVLYRDGLGVSKDDKEAVYWFRKSAEHENARAQTSLGFMYENGRGVSQDYREALVWYLKAAEQGYDVAQLNIGMAYQFGRGVDVDSAAARRWLEKAAAQGNVRAKAHLERLTRTY